MNWHPYPEEKPAQLWALYLVRWIRDDDSISYKTNIWQEDGWNYQVQVTHWCEIVEPREEAK